MDDRINPGGVAAFKHGKGGRFKLPAFCQPANIAEETGDGLQECRRFCRLIGA